ncbi:MAG: metallophosphoesterase [Bdellovibrionota bacterium]
MITDVRSERLIVISDLHLGNPFSHARERVIGFLRWAALNKFDIVINGDVFEIAQVSFGKIAKDVPEVLRALKLAIRSGCNIYYVIGNHDIVLENLLEDWGAFKMAPFLNVRSGSARIRIEHGHLYDPFFIKYPKLYEFCTWIAGFVLHLSPKYYKLWIAFERLKSRLRRRRERGIVGEHPHFYDAAHELLRRGFDSVVFGHTHHVGEVAIGQKGKYFNPGTWMFGTHYVEIISGIVKLKKWE